MTREVVVGAGLIETARLRSLDAIHVSTALSVPGGVDAFVSYDARQLVAAQAASLAILSP